MFTGPHIVTDGLILHLDAANTKSYPGSGTTWYDLSKNSNNATLVNGPVYTTTYGGMFDFDGINEYAYITDKTSLDLSGDKSQCIWIYMDQTYSGTGIMGKSDSSVFGMSLTYGWSSGGFENIAWNSTNNPQIPPAATDINNWYYLAGTQAGSTRSVYVIGANGIRTASFGSGTHTWSNNLDFTIGQLAGFYYTNMKTSTVQVYNRALTQQEILQNYNATKSRFNL